MLSSRSLLPVNDDFLQGSFFGLLFFEGIFCLVDMHPAVALEGVLIGSKTLKPTSSSNNKQLEMLSLELEPGPI